MEEGLSLVKQLEYDELLLYWTLLRIYFGAFDPSLPLSSSVQPQLSARGPAPVQVRSLAGVLLLPNMMEKAFSQ